ncbi:aminotransferase class III-fold pyridoxal phosphate-dependent enzyme [Salinactinospora qingdaonensis]|uniref:Aspartate aminotransferase family protein n=1 Tax=Salinactinospora qingdaonensis TaxID=702744 RepID=A0ABP7FNN5_9ACTN
MSSVVRFRPARSTGPWLTAAGGEGPYLRTLEGRRLVDATAGADSVAGDRVLLGYDWQPQISAGRSPLLPALPPPWTRSQEHHLTANLSALLGWDHVALAPSGETAAQALASIGEAGWADLSWPPGAALALNLTELADPAASSHAVPVSEARPRLAGAEHLSVLERVERALRRARPDPVRAIIVHATTALPVPTAPLKQLRRLCQDHDVILGWDETRLGLARSGTPLLLSTLTDPEDRPDIAAVGDSLTAGFGPLGALLVDTRLLERARFEAHDTGDIHPLAAAVAVEVLHAIADHELAPKAIADGAYLHRGLTQRLAPGAHVHSQGLDVSIHPPSPGESPSAGRRLASIAGNHGLRVRATDDGTGLRLTPPLTCRRHHLDTIIDLVAATLTHPTHAFQSSPGQEAEPPESAI